MKKPKTFANLLEEVSDSRWPKKGDRLLRPASWNDGAEFSGDPISRHVHIWSGYMRAGAALVAESSGDRIDRHFLVYPILFNYRHALELAMKWTIDRYGRYADVRLDKDELDHDLWKLWRHCKAVIIQVGSEGEDDEALAVVEQIVKDFHDLDKTAMAFRYPTTKRGSSISLPQGAIDLDNVRNIMEAVDNFFSGVDGQLDANSSAQDWDF